MGLNHGQVKPRTIKLVYVASPPSMEYAKTVDLVKNPIKHVYLVQSGHHHHLNGNVTCSHHNIAEKCEKQQSLTHLIVKKMYFCNFRLQV